MPRNGQKKIRRDYKTQKRELYELLYAEVVKSGTIIMASDLIVTNLALLSCLILNPF